MAALIARLRTAGYITGLPAETLRERLSADVNRENLEGEAEADKA
jgi:hypothetical protein